MKAATVVFLVVLAANAQTTQKSASHRAAPAPAPQRMSHDFRTAGRRAVSAIGDLGRVPRSAWCNAGACDAMYTTCKKEAEDAFESGVLPAKSQCKSLSPRDPNKD